MYLENFQKIRTSYWQIVSLGLLARILKLIQGALLAYFLLDSHDLLGDYELAFSSTMLLTGFLMTGIHFALIASIQLAESDYGIEGRMETSNKFLNIIILLSLGLVALTILQAAEIVNYIDPSLSQKQVQEIVGLVRLGSPIISLHFIRAVGVGYLQSDNRFISGAKSGVANVLVYLAYIVLFRDRLSPRGLILTGLLAVMVQIYILFKSIYGDGYRYKFEVDFRDKYVKKTLGYMLMIALAVLLIDQLIKIDGLSLKSLRDTYPLEDIAGPIDGIQDLFLLALITTIYPILSKNYIDGRFDRLKDISKFSFYLLLILVLPLGLGLGLLAEPIIDLRFTNQALSLVEISSMTRIFRLSLLGMMGSIFFIYTTRLYYTLRDYKMPLILGLAYLGLNYIFNQILVGNLGSPGLVLSRVLSLAIISIYSIYDYNRRIDFIDLEDFRSNMLVILGSLVTMLVFILITKFAFGLLFESSQMASGGLVIFASFGGGLVYFFSMRDSLRKINRKKQASHKKKRKR